MKRSRFDRLIISSYTWDSCWKFIINQLLLWSAKYDKYVWTVGKYIKYLIILIRETAGCGPQ